MLTQVHPAHLPPDSLDHLPGTEVVFGFPHQTVRLTHDSILGEAFGAGAAFALRELRQRAPGFYTMEDLIAGMMRSPLQAA